MRKLKIGDIVRVRAGSLTYSGTVKKIGSKYIIASSQSKALNNKILEEFKNVDNTIELSIKFPPVL